MIGACVLRAHSQRGSCVAGADRAPPLPPGCSLRRERKRLRKLAGMEEEEGAALDPVLGRCPLRHNCLHAATLDFVVRGE